MGIFGKSPQKYKILRYRNTLYVYMEQNTSISKLYWKTGLTITFLSGGAFPFTVGRIEHGFNVRPDLCAVENSVNPRKYLGRIYTDSLVHDDKCLRLLVDVIGEVSVMLKVLPIYFRIFILVSSF